MVVFYSASGPHFKGPRYNMRELGEGLVKRVRLEIFGCRDLSEVTQLMLYKRY